MPGPTRALSLAGTASGLSEPLMWEGYDDGIYDGVGFYDDDAITFPTKSPSIVGDDNNSQELVVGVPRAVVIGSGKNELVEV